MSKRKYHDPDHLRELYYDEKLSIADIADRHNVAYSTVRYHFKKHNIERRDGPSVTDDTPWRDAEWLREKYIEEGLSSREIADIADGTFGVILRWLDKHDIEKRDPGRHRNGQMKVTTDRKGHEYVQHRNSDDSTSKVKIHRLAAIAWFGLDAVVDSDVHHGSPESDHFGGVPWDNRESVLQPLSHSTHTKLHDRDRRERGLDTGAV